MKNQSLVGCTKKEIEALLDWRDDASLRSKQMASQIYKRAQSEFSQMADLPAQLRQELEQRFLVSPLEVSRHVRSSDSVQKLLVHNGDGNAYECVLIPYPDRVSCCISSQVGCPMGCRFCATGLGGFDRNLEVSEIVGQYLKLQSLTPRRISHVVFMGMGEPLLNVKSVVASLKILHDEVGLSYRHLTVSTVGIVPAIYQLADLKLPIHLALSLHSPYDDVRQRLMPVNAKWNVAETVGAMKDYSKATGRKVTFEYLLIKGVTDTLDQAERIATLTRGFPCFVNLIPFNWVDTEQGFARPDRKSVNQFRAKLEQAGVNVTERMERGHDIAAACGQLAGQFKQTSRQKTLPQLA